jgi:Domain of unknown function (DUF6048)
VKKKIVILFYLMALIVPETICQEMGPLKQGISIGYDFSGLIVNIFQPTQTSGEVSVTAGAFKKLYYTVEAGILTIYDRETDFNYFSNGQYIRAGFDYNFYKRKTPDENNMVFLGLRYGLATMHHSADNITIEDAYWGNYSPKPIPDSKVNAQWIEIAAGIRVELIKNFSMGWSGRVHFLTHLASGPNKPFMIPGFGSGYSTITLGFNYSIYYTIPLRKYKK